MHLETLESRLLFSSVTFENQTLTIVGSPGRDRIRVNILIVPTGSHARVLINGHGGYVRDFPLWASPLPAVIIRSGLGDDTIKFGTLNNLPTTIFAGAGNDHIHVHERSTLVFAGRGDDHVNVDSGGMAGSTVFGGDGDDQITGISGNHEFHGEKGNDSLIGGAGAERLFGDAGNDALKGGEGIDSFFGGAGNDRFYSQDANANEPGDGGEGMDRALFADCSLPFDEFPNIESIQTVGTNRPYWCGCC